MGFFTKKKVEEAISEKSEEYAQKEELEAEMENIQNEYRAKQEELNEIRQKIEMVKDEYEATVSSLMLVKKELNQKKLELDVAVREHKEISEKIRKSEKITDSESISRFSKTEESLLRIKQELKKITKEYDQTKEQMTQEQALLRSIRNQNMEYKKELEEATSRLYNAKEELAKKDQFQDTSVLTPKEKEFIGGDDLDQKTSAGVIEAASAVVGSLKSKLNMTQKELEAIQLLLEQERDAHNKTKQELEKLRRTKS